MRALVVVRRPGSGSVRVRVGQMRPALADQGIDSQVLVWGGARGLDRLRRPVDLVAAARGADVIVLHKPALPERLLDLLGRMAPVVVDVDDAVWASVEGGDDAAPGALGRRFDAAVRRAALVVAGSEHLRDEVRRRTDARRVEVIRPSVLLADYEVAEAPPERPTLGWLGGGGNQADLTAEVRGVLAGWCARHDGELVVVSNVAPRFDDVPTRFVAWSPEVEHVVVNEFTVGLMPLRPDARSAGRCGFKAIQCMAAGVPVVTSPVGAGLEVGAGGGAVVADGAAEWSAALDRLTLDAAFRRRTGDRARRWVAQHASVEANAPRLGALLREVAS